MESGMQQQAEQKRTRKTGPTEYAVLRKQDAGDTRPAANVFVLIDGAVSASSRVEAIKTVTGQGGDFITIRSAEVKTHHRKQRTETVDEFS